MYYIPAQCFPHHPSNVALPVILFLRDILRRVGCFLNRAGNVYDIKSISESFFLQVAKSGIGDFVQRSIGEDFE